MMLYSEIAAVFTLLILLGNDEFKYERASQTILLGIALQVSSKTAASPILRAPLIIILLFGTVFELMQINYKLKHKVAKKQMEQIQDLITQQKLRLL